MKRLNSIEELQDAIMLDKEIYFSLFHTSTEGKLFQQLLDPKEHIDSLKQRIVELKDDDIQGVFSCDKIENRNIFNRHIQNSNGHQENSSDGTTIIKKKCQKPEYYRCVKLYGGCCRDLDCEYYR